MLIDSHFHLANYGEDITFDDVLVQARSEGVTKFVLIGTEYKENKRVVKTAALYPDVYAVIGAYPHSELKKDLGTIYQELAGVYAESKQKIVGIGECGIDITESTEGRSIEDQVELFKMQIGFAATEDLPIVIHNRNGDSQVLDLIKKYHSDGVMVRGVLHCFASSWKFAKQMLDLGFYISFSGLITYPSRKELLETVKNIPSDRFIIETDSPYLPPQGHRGETNCPKYVKIVAEKVAEIRNTSFETIADLTYKNACTLFSKMTDHGK